VRANEEVLTLESIKAASDVYAPISGTIIEVHTELEKTPELINSDPYTEGWLFRMEFDDMKEIDALMSSEEYSATLQPEE
jgi:glycine cleavage system H protein